MTRVRLGPADHVTLVRAALVVVVAGLLLAGGATAAVPVAVVALLLDLVDGQVARRTGTASASGARFDMETDALLILVLSVHVAAAYGAWVLLIGAARYLLWGAEVVWPWLRRTVPPRYWRKVVAAYVGIALALAASGLAPAATTYGVLVVAALLLAESFGWDVVWLWRRRLNRAGAADVLPAKVLEHGR
jgi:phosphatidylglycerophosphate synthase